LISKSYPYVDIARRYDLNYSDVLAVAHYLTHGGPMPTKAVEAIPGRAHGDIVAARDYFRAVQDGSVPFH
jgi:hypothetical protein